MLTLFRLLCYNYICKKKKGEKMTKKQQNLLIFMCWALYVSAYLGRYSYTANIVPIISAFGKTKTETGLISSMFFFAYGAGQIINGLLCKYYNTKYMLFGSLIVSSIINIAIFLGVPFVAYKYLWLVNGLAQSILWSSLIMTLSKNLDEHHIKKAVLVMSTTTSVGVFLSYGLSALLVMFNVYQIIFLIATVVMSVSAVFWVLLYNKMTLRETPSEEEHFEVKVKQQKQKTDRSVYKILVIFGLFAVVVNLIKDGLSTWIPNVLKEIYGLQDSLSIFLTLFVPVLGIFASAMVVAMNKKIKDHNALMAILFAMATVLSLVVVLMLKTSAWVVVLIAFAALVFLMSASNNVITSILPFWLRDKANSGFVAGILNGCCYVGSTISSVGLGSIAENFGWSIVFDIFLILTAVVVLYACIILIVKKIKEKRNKTI